MLAVPQVQNLGLQIMGDYNKFIRSRRAFLKLSGVALTAMALPHHRAAARNAHPEITSRIILEHDDSQFLWFHPRACSVPARKPNKPPRIVLTLQKHLRVSDYYSGLWYMISDDLGQTWHGPVEIPTLAWREGPNQTTESIADVTPGFHPPTGRVLAIGAGVFYRRDGHQAENLPVASPTVYAVYDPERDAWSERNVLELPDDPRFHTARCACAQWLVQPDGSLLLPLYFKPREATDYTVAVVRCSFDGSRIIFQSMGNEMTVAGGRGLCEPSLVRCRDRFFLTLRNNDRGYVTSGMDGLHFESIRSWSFDDGSDLGSYNTQQHWLTHQNRLYLSYTRRGAGNDHIPRHRAPLFLAEVDPERLVVLRDTEQVLIPERGATLGNFGAGPVTPDESWVTVSEGVWSDEARQRGATGATWIASIRWNT